LLNNLIQYFEETVSDWLAGQLSVCDDWLAGWLYCQ